MRHIILGSDTTIGSSVVRLLASINAENVIAVSNLGELPSGVDPKRATAVFGDVTDLYTVNNLFEEGDIVYYCQVVRDESSNYKDAELYNVKGFINLLGFASDAKVQKIVCALPQALGYELPQIADEDELGKIHSPIQKTLLKLREIANIYENGEDFGFKQSIIDNIRNPPTQEIEVSQESSMKGTPSSGPSLKGAPSSGPSLKGTPSSGPSLKGTPSSGPSLKGTPSSGPSLKGTPSSGPSLKGTPSSGPSLKGTPSSGPSLKGAPSSGPSLKGAQLNDEDNESQSVSEENVSEDKSGRVTDDEISDEEIKEEEEVEEESFEYEPVPIIIGRIARLFGPFEDSLTTHFCRAVRLQRIEIHGPMENRITWINPIDAGRAMIILADPNVDVSPGEYHLNGFLASPMQLLEMLDEINHSNIEITQKGLFVPKMINYLTSGLNAIGLNLRSNYYEYLSLNSRQIFDDSKAREEFGWEAKFKVKQTLKDAMSWFINHRL